jgi:hypothetical protein
MIFGPDLVEEAETTVGRIQDNLRVAITPRELCKQEAPTLGVCSWGSCVSEGFTYERHEVVWNE